jgi:hypothetical protein
LSKGAPHEFPSGTTVTTMNFVGFGPIPVLAIGSIELYAARTARCGVLELCIEPPDMVTSTAVDV